MTKTWTSNHKPNEHKLSKMKTAVSDRIFFYQKIIENPFTDKDTLIQVCQWWASTGLRWHYIIMIMVQFAYLDFSRSSHFTGPKLRLPWLTYHLHHGVSQDVTFTLIPNYIGSCHGQILIEQKHILLMHYVPTVVIIATSQYCSCHSHNRIGPRIETSNISIPSDSWKY